MRNLTLDEVLELHRLALEQSGGAEGVGDVGLLQSAVAQPQVIFGGQDLYSGVADKAVALGYSLILNHSFADGNKRVGHAAMETLLVLNGYEIVAGVEEQEHLILGVAAGTVSGEAFLEWVRTHLIERGPAQAPPLNGPGN